jgi:WD40 repeat protein
MLQSQAKHRPFWLSLCVVLWAQAAVSAQEAAKEKPHLVFDAGGHTTAVGQVIFRRSGREIVTVSNDKTIRIWDAASGTPLRILRPPIGEGQIGELNTAALAPDDNTLAVGGYGDDQDDTPIYLISLSDGKMDRVLRGHDNAISGLSFDAQGKWLASASLDETVRIWNRQTGACVHVLKGHTKPVRSVSFAPDGSRVASASDDQTARIWDAKSGASLHTLRGHKAAVMASAWTSDGQRLATGGYDQSIMLWGRDGKQIYAFGRLRGEITSLRFIAQDRELLFTTSSTDDGFRRAACLDLYKTGAVRVEFEHTNTVYAADVSPDGRWIVSSGGDNSEAYVWQTANGKEISRLAGRGRTPWAAGWGPTGSQIAWGNTNNAARFEDLAPLERTFSLETLELGAKPDARFSGRHITLGNASLKFEGANTIKLKRGNKSLTFEPFSDTDEVVHCGTLLPERYAAVGTEFGLYLFDTQTGKRVRDFVGHTGVVWNVAVSPNGRYLLSASNDQTLRVWRLDQDAPLVSLFFAGQEWIAWTPEGYYAASPGGEQLMGWHVNNGFDKLATFHPAARFRKSLYRPDVIKLLLRTGSSKRALEAADEARGKKSGRPDAGQTNIAQVLPPKVRLLSPDKPLTVRETVLAVRARASSAGSRPVTALHLHLDGRPLPAGLFRVATPKIGDVETSWSITLSPGKHRLAARAESAVSSSMSDEIEINVVAPDPGEQVRLPSLYVLAIGISDYPADLKLNYAAKDAQTLAKTFQNYSKALYEKIVVKELTNRAATQRDILLGISWLKKQTTQRDVAVLFFAGHGDLSADGTMYLLPADIDPGNLEATGVSADQIKSLLTGLPGRVVFMLDACHAGGIDGKTKPATKKRGGKSLTDDLIRDLVADERGVIALCASTGKQFALESNEHRHGLFTLALVEGLKGKATKTVDGAVYLHHLDAYVTDRVKELSQGQQSPTTARPASVRSFPLSRP